MLAMLFFGGKNDNENSIHIDRVDEYDIALVLIIRAGY
jgi:hypothetical protein